MVFYSKEQQVGLDAAEKAAQEQVNVDADRYHIRIQRYKQF
jgi:hypothetical protein